MLLRRHDVPLQDLSKRLFPVFDFLGSLGLSVDQQRGIALKSSIALNFSLSKVQVLRVLGGRKFGWLAHLRRRLGLTRRGRVCFRRGWCPLASHSCQAALVLSQSQPSDPPCPCLLPPAQPTRLLLQQRVQWLRDVGLSDAQLRLVLWKHFRIGEPAGSLAPLPVGQVLNSLLLSRQPLHYCLWCSPGAYLATPRWLATRSNWQRAVSWRHCRTHLATAWL